MKKRSCLLKLLKALTRWPPNARGKSPCGGIPSKLYPCHSLRPKSSLGYAENLIFRALYSLAICALTSER